jgi:hypothetical protein
MQEGDREVIRKWQRQGINHSINKETWMLVPFLLVIRRFGKGI